MRVLLDTHALLWWLAGDERLSPAARVVIGDANNTVLVSAASAWEIATKYRIGKLPEAEEVALDFASCLADHGFTAQGITVEHAQRAGLLAGDHRDPFDRMLITQSLALGVPIISNEGCFDSFGVSRIW